MVLVVKARRRRKSVVVLETAMDGLDGEKTRNRGSSQKMTMNNPLALMSPILAMMP